VAIGVGRAAPDHEGPDVSSVQKGTCAFLVLRPRENSFRPYVKDDEFRPGKDHSTKFLVHKGAASERDYPAAPFEGIGSSGKFMLPKDRLTEF